MSKNNTFDACTTKAEVKDLLKELNAEPYRIIRDNKKACTERCKIIRKAELAPYHDVAKRWKQGQKVYFGTGDNLSYLSFETMRMTKEYDIKPGQWCYVWHYQPKVKLLWLCHPGKKCEFKNVINRAFSLDRIERCKISRTEPAIRA